MTVYVLFNPNNEMMEICKDVSTALALVNELAEGSYHVSRDTDNTYVHTEDGTFLISKWDVME